MDRDLMQVVFSLTKAGHQQYVPEIVERMRHERGYVPGVSCHGRWRNMEPLASNFALSTYHSGPYWAIMVPYVFIAVFYFKCFKYEPRPIREMVYIQYWCSEKLLWDFGKVINNWSSFLFWYWPIHLFLFPQMLWTSAWVWLLTDMKRLRFLCWRASPACW